MFDRILVRNFGQNFGRALVCSFLLLASVVAAQTPGSQTPNTRANDEALSQYFAAETSELATRCLADIDSAETWQEKRGEYRQQLLEMLGLDPWPEKTPLEVTVTGIVEHDDFVVQKLHYQSRPGLYVTANLYVPKEVTEPLPAILYVCGHGKVSIDGVSYGNKVHYQHHPAWFARNGYVCLSIDTLQLGEIEGIHHGTHREGMWWWLNRGYTPAGVEAWNCVRAIDLLQQMEEVDGERIGVTGRSGGGAYSWWIAAIDERIKCAVPVAGVTDLQNHVVDGCVEGHCDCMFMVNTYRWDYPMLAAMVAPRPLLISNTDSDGIFPLDGVVRTHAKAKRIYELVGAKDNIALHITAGPHKDTQELRVHAFRWMNKHLKGDAESAVLPAEKFFDPTQLKVLSTIPADQQNTEIQEHFVETAEPTLPNSVAAWQQQRSEWMTVLREKSFRGWPEKDVPLNIEKMNSDDGVIVEFDSQQHVRLRMRLTNFDMQTTKQIELRVLNDGEQPESNQAADTSKDLAIAYFSPRGCGDAAWNPATKKQTQIRRRFYLLGQTRDGMQVYDVRRAVQVLRELGEATTTVRASGVMAGIGLYASLFEDDVSQLQLDKLPDTHRNGPIFLNVRKHFDMPQAVAMAVGRAKIDISGNGEFQFAEHIAKLMGRSKGWLRVGTPR